MSWVSVKDRLPENARLVLLNLKDSHFFRIGYLKNDDVWANAFSKNRYRFEEVTHWRELPAPPETD